MVRSQHFKNLVTALKKEGFKVGFFETSTDLNRGYYSICLYNKKRQVRIYDGRIRANDFRVFISLNKEYNKLQDCREHEMPQTPEELRAIVLEIKTCKTQYPPYSR